MDEAEVQKENVWLPKPLLNMWLVPPSEWEEQEQGKQQVVAQEVVALQVLISLLHSCSACTAMVRPWEEQGWGCGKVFSHPSRSSGVPYCHATAMKASEIVVSTLQILAKLCLLRSIHIKSWVRALPRLKIQALQVISRACMRVDEPDIVGLQEVSYF